MVRALALAAFVAVVLIAMPADASDAHKPAKPAAAPAKPAPANLATVAKKIHEGLAEASKNWDAKKPAARAATPPRLPAAPHVRLEWRPSVSWPDELVDAVSDTPAVSPRASLAWGTLDR